MPGVTFESDNENFDSQDQSETLDEANLIGDGDQGEVRTFADADDRTTFEDLPELMDMTRADGDRDDDEALALDADEFEPDAIDEADFEADNELDYRAATAEREDDVDGQGPEDGFKEDRLGKDDIQGLDQVRDAAEARGGEADVTDFQAGDVSDAELIDLGYAERKGGEVRAKPDD